MNLFLSAAQLIGGIGLFVLGISMISDGFRLVAGEGLRNILGRWTNSLGRGMAAGAGLTAVAQSSSAVTIATIGFVNAGLITLHQSLGVIYGANIGTTMTGWLISVVGFGLKIEAFALPLIGIGALTRLLGGASRKGAAGVALAGFGLFFLGVDVLRETFQEAAVAVDLSRWSAASATDIALLVLVGAIMTTLTQSSSAAMALILTAVAGGVLPLTGAAAMVIGANVGTTSTAVLAVIGATANARRVAAAHVIFNVVTAAIALGILPLMLWLIQKAGDVLTGENAPALTIAMFHTLFNALGAAVMWPLTPRMTKFLEGRFRTTEELEQRPRYLDDAVAKVPALAIGALSQEISRVGAIATELFVQAIDLSRAPAPDALSHKRSTVQALIVAIAEFVIRIQKTELPANISGLLTDGVHATTQYADIVALAAIVAGHRGVMARLQHGSVRAALERLSAEATSNLDALNKAAVNDQDGLSSIQSAFQQHYALTRNEVLQAATEGRFDVAQLESILETLRCIRRAVEQAIKAAGLKARLDAGSGST
jgi:phosphate:Na+ symporter